MKKIFYWSPCLANVGTVRSTINSAIALSKYNGSKNQVYLINACGEWDQYKKLCIQNNIKLINLTFNYFNFLPKEGFILSRISYFLVFVISYLPLLNIIKKYKPDYVILHLITSLPLYLMLVHNLNNKFILRISGLPKLNFFRKKFWNICSKKLYKVTSPTADLIDQIKEMNIFRDDQIFFLPDAIIKINNIKLNKSLTQILENIQKKYFISVGRLTKQKNFGYLIKEFEKFSKVNLNYDLLIFGEGEQFNYLKKLINMKKLENRIFLMGYSKNIYEEMKKASCFLLTSLWEAPGFVLIEAAFSNLFIISSNCKNGPREFLSNGDAGILYETDKQDALYKSLMLYEKTNISEIRNKKLKAKINCKKYTIFSHFLKLNHILV